MGKRLYISDLDGTLLNHEGKLTEYTEKKLNQLIDRGINFTVASARSLKSIQQILSGVNLQLPVISFNGGYISDFKNSKHLLVQNIETINVERIIDIIGSGCLISTHEAGQDILYYDRVRSEGMLKYMNDRKVDLNQPIPSFKNIDEIIHKDIMAFTVIDHEEVICKLKKKLMHQLGELVTIDAWEDMYYKGWYWLSIHSKMSTKAEAIKILRNLDDNHIDELYVFGDNTNDKEMFYQSDKAFAVENAVPSIKLMADCVIGHHNENSVVNKIMELEGYANDTVSK